MLFVYFHGLQHKDAMSTKPVFKKIAKIQRSYVQLCGHTTFVLLTPARNMTISDTRYFAMMQTKRLLPPNYWQ